MPQAVVGMVALFVKGGFAAVLGVGGLAAPIVNAAISFAPSDGMQYGSPRSRT